MAVRVRGDPGSGVSPPPSHRSQQLPPHHPASRVCVLFLFLLLSRNGNDGKKKERRETRPMKDGSERWGCNLQRTRVEQKKEGRHNLCC